MATSQKPIPSTTKQEQSYPINMEQLTIKLILENEELRKQKEALIGLQFEEAVRLEKIKIKELRKGELEDKTIESIEEKF